MWGRIRKSRWLKESAHFESIRNEYRIYPTNAHIAALYSDIAYFYKTFCLANSYYLAAPKKARN